MRNPRRLYVPCGDAVGRDRFVSVREDDERVVLALPPGEAAALTVDQVATLRGALLVVGTLQSAVLPPRPGCRHG